ncbi:MAG: hypothetical protein WCP08_14280 [Prolixibacteraceae bacterium]
MEDDRYVIIANSAFISIKSAFQPVEVRFSVSKQRFGRGNSSILHCFSDHSANFVPETTFFVNTLTRISQAMPIIPDFTDQKTLEKYSSAFTLSDMEIFVFPDLLYSLVIANIMSPVIWKWRDEEWFEGISKKSSNFKINRIKQYIMDHYVFNLDLETWGLTDKETEINRFKGAIDIDILKRSNALFGYEGDKYYFDIDIRRHFGLDKYESDIIPYWKTETVEAMTAFRFRDSFDRGAGECVSLSALYAAALFIVGGIPLEQMYLMGTPLHSQNFIDINDGVLTNNRRIVSKKMWFNGTSISTRARRALEHEKITIVSHLSGYIHYLYETATINKAAYRHFSGKLTRFLTTQISAELFINFLRYHMKFKKCFQYRHFMNSRNYYIPMETIFEYEHSTRHVFSESGSEALLQEIDDEEFSIVPLPDLLVLQEIITYLQQNKESTVIDLMKFSLEEAKGSKEFTKETIKLLFSELGKFLKVEPKLPDTKKKFIDSETLNIHIRQDRAEIAELITRKSAENELALLSLYAYRDMGLIDWKPFLIAALQRNPVSVEGLKGKTADEAYQLVSGLTNESIYDAQRLAMPDETWNFGRGDGIEKALLLANFLVNALKIQNINLTIRHTQVLLECADGSYLFHSEKGIVNALSNISN